MTDRNEIESKALLLYDVIGSNCWAKNPRARADIFCECVKAAAISHQLDEIKNLLNDISTSLHDTNETIFDSSNAKD